MKRLAEELKSFLISVFVFLVCGFVFIGVHEGVQRLTTAQSTASESKKAALLYTIALQLQLAQEQRAQESEPETSEPETILIPEIRFEENRFAEIREEIAADEGGGTIAKTETELGPVDDVKETASPAAFLILYTGPNCEPCRMLEVALKKAGVEYEKRAAEPGQAIPYATLEGNTYVGDEIYEAVGLSRPKRGAKR